jgi:hypothetical protein
MGNNNAKKQSAKNIVANHPRLQSHPVVRKALAVQNGTISDETFAIAARDLYVSASRYGVGTPNPLEREKNRDCGMS